MSVERLSRVVALLSCLAPCGCILITDHDLHIVRVEDVTVLGAPRPPARQWWASEAGIVTIVFATDLDVRAYAADYENSHRIELSMCRRGRIDGSQLLDDMVYVGDGDDGIRDWAQGVPGAGALRYRFRVQLARHHVSDDATPSYNYDLRAAPQDICFRVRGGQMLGRGYVSNTMIIPAADLADAIRKADG